MNTFVIAIHHKREDTTDKNWSLCLGLTSGLIFSLPPFLSSFFFFLIIATHVFYIFSMGVYVNTHHQ